MKKKIMVLIYEKCYKDNTVLTAIKETAPTRVSAVSLIAAAP